MRCGINYVIDGPCGDCPQMFTCNSDDCFHWLLWDYVTQYIEIAIMKVGK